MRRPVPRVRRPPGLVTAILATTLLGSTLLVPTAQAAGRHPHQRPGSVDVRVIGFNDFHGNLQPPTGSSGEVTLDDGTTVSAGGAAYLATHLKQLRAEAKHSFVVASGDNIGASPLASALFHDEPTIDVLNAIGVTASAVGNHEFDEGYAELQRIQRGGECHPTDGCVFRDTYEGADFPYLGANVRLDNGRRALLPFTVKVSGGVPIGIIGVTLQDLPSVVIPSAVEGLKFGDEVAAIDRTSKLLTRFGIKAQIVLMHQGDRPEDGGPNACDLPDGGVALRIASEASPQVDAFFTAHSHQQYNCSVKDPQGVPRPVIQGLSFGRLLSVVDLTIDRRSRDVIRSETAAKNVAVTNGPDIVPDAEVGAIVDEAVAKSAPIANRQVGVITKNYPRGSSTPPGETELGDIIADAQLAATLANGAQIAITNPGGIRTDLTYPSSPAGEGDGVVTYGEAFAVQPFSNIMQTITLTGAQLEAVLEQQSQGTQTRFLQVSAGLSYTWTSASPVGAKVSDLRFDGAPVDPGATYRVSLNNFLADGGDGFTVFAEGVDLVGGPIDLDAFTTYLTAHQPLPPPTTGRITVR